MTQRGFTLIELLLGLILSGILAQLAVPSFKGLLESQQRHSAAQSLVGGLRYARSEAIARNRAVVIHALDDDWSRGWRVIVDLKGAAIWTTIIPYCWNTRTMGAYRSWAMARSGARYASAGWASPVFAGGGFRAGTVHVCATDQAQSLFQVVLAPSGRISLRRDKTEQALCRGSLNTLGLRAANAPAAPWAWRK